MRELTIDGQASLYLHIPTCSNRCSYCNFYSEPRAVWNHTVEQYTQRLLAEVVHVTEHVGRFETIYIGGGDPLNAGVEALSALLRAAQKQGRAAEVTIEANPETLHENFAPLFAHSLATRLSLGIQTMDDRLLSLIGRRASRAVNERALKRAESFRREYGVELSVDLMVCLPSQSPLHVIEDLRAVLSCAQADHLSLYCLTVEEGTDLASQVGSGKLTIHDEDSQATFLVSIWDHLTSLGYAHYEISNFARPGKQSRHNGVYWQLGTYIGLGCSAASFVQPVHYRGEQSYEQWLVTEAFSGYSTEVLSAAQIIEEYLMVRLRTAEGIDKPTFSDRFGVAFDRLFFPALRSLDPKWYIDTPQLFALTEDGWMILDEILLRLLAQIP